MGQSTGPMPEGSTQHKVVQVRLLGELEVTNCGKRLELPPSKKTRALLAYLATTGRPHRRERLCSLLWEIPDDPRGALRWSLSKLRSLLDEPQRPRLIADRESVSLAAEDLEIDIVEVRRQAASGLEELTTEELRAAAAAFRGEFLEGLDLPALEAFQAWCIAEREEARRLQVRILEILSQRLVGEPEAALPFARSLARIDPYGGAARARLIRLLLDCGRIPEARQQMEAAERAMAEAGLDEPAFSALRRDLAGVKKPQPQAGRQRSKPEEVRSANRSFVGRERERTRLAESLSGLASGRPAPLLLVTGETGLGKSRLMEEFAALARGRGMGVLLGRSYEAEQLRPYGPWIDALRGLPYDAVEPQRKALTPLLPELGGSASGELSRDLLLAGVAAALGEAASRQPFLVILDDVQWLDEASATLLHFLSRTLESSPLLFALTARSAELPDNAAVERALHSLRRERGIEEMSLEPLDAPAMADLLCKLLPESGLPGVIAASGGNPLFALELARSRSEQDGGLPGSLKELVRQRVAHLPHSALEAVRWAAVFGKSFGVASLGEVSGMPLEDFVEAIEVLERHALLRPEPLSHDPLGDYVFAHELVRQALYGEISLPRRRLMHRRIAEALSARPDPQASSAAAVAHHAALAGDAELAARACVAAGRRCLAVFANTEAAGLARAGMRYAERLPEAERVKLLLELTEISLAARRPASFDDAVRTIETLAELALDLGCSEHARLGYHMISLLRWEGGRWTDAQRLSLQAEMVSRTAASVEERVVGMAEAARCLALLERDLPQAEALLLEARALASRLDLQPSAIAAASGLLRLHEGKYAEAAELLERARQLARRAGDRLGEFMALEHRIAVELEQGQLEPARQLWAGLNELGSKLREGSESSYAEALGALLDFAAEGKSAVPALQQALVGLKQLDAKFRLAFLSNLAGEIALGRGDLEETEVWGEEALAAASTLERASEMAVALSLLYRQARTSGNAARAEAMKARACELAEARLSDRARRALAPVLAAESRGAEAW